MQQAEVNHPFWRQGDIYFVKIDEEVNLSKGTTLKNGIIARGEQTGARVSRIRARIASKNVQDRTAISPQGHYSSALPNPHGASLIVLGGFRGRVVVKGNLPNFTDHALGVRDGRFDLSFAQASFRPPAEYADD